MNRLGRKRRRRERRAAWWGALGQDIRHAVRSLRRTPGFTIAALLIVGLGIGMSTAMFTVFKTVLVDRLPIRAQDQVVVMHTLDRSGRNLDVPYTYLVEVARDSALFQGVAGVYHFLRPEHEQPGAPPVVVLSYAAWRRNFGGGPSVVGHSLVIPYTQERARIIGVAPPGFEYPSSADVWMAIPQEANTARIRTAEPEWFEVIGVV